MKEYFVQKVDNLIFCWKDLTRSHATHLKIIRRRDSIYQSTEIANFSDVLSFTLSELGDQGKDIVSPYRLSCLSSNTRFENLVVRVNCQIQWNIYFGTASLGHTSLANGCPDKMYTHKDLSLAHTSDITTCVCGNSSISYRPKDIPLKSP